MSPHGLLFAHATDWMASTAECADAQRIAPSPTMDSRAVHVLLGDTRMLHDR